MRVLYVTGDLREGDLLQHEAAKASSDIKVELSPDLSDAVVRLDTAGPYDLVLTESQLPNGDCLTLIDHIRQRNLSPAVVVIIPPHDADPPARLLKAGADDYVVRRPNFMSRIPGLMQQTVERHRGRAQRRARPLRVLYAGDIESARRQLTRAPFIELEVASISPEGHLQRAGLVQPGSPAVDAVVLEDQAVETPVLKVLKETLYRWPEYQVIVLLAPGQDDVAIQALRLGAADCITKTGDFYERLVLALETLMVRRELAREKASLRSSEERLRMVVEYAPACVTLLAPDGTFLAMNWAGLSLVGAKQVDDVIGKNLCTLVGPDQGEHLKSFIERICSGERDATRISWEGLDSVPRELELRAVPLRRDPNGTTVALAVMQKLPPSRSDETLGQLQEDHARLQQALQDAENRLLEATRRQAEEQAGWEAERQQLDQLRETAEQQKRAAEEALASAEAALAESAALHEAEHSHWDSAVRESGSRLEAAEGRAAQAEEKCRSLEEKLAATETRFAEERERLESLIGDLEQRLLAAFEQHRRNEEAVVAARATAAEVGAGVDKERSLWRSLREDLERRLAEAESKRSELEKELQQFESRWTEVSQRHDAERRSWEERIRELESLEREVSSGRSRLEEALQAAQARCAEISAHAEGYQVRLAELQASSELLEQDRLAWGEQKQLLEQRVLNLQGDLQAAEAWRLELEERQHAEKDQIEAARAELAVRAKSAEEERDALRQALGAAESRIAEAAERFETERSDWQAIRQSIEDRCRTLEEQLPDAEMRAARTATDLQSLQAGWEEARRELEHRVHGLESEKTSLKETLEAEQAAREEMTESQQTIRAELENRLGEALQRATMFEDLCRQAEIRGSELTLHFQTERAQWDAARLQLQEKLRAQDSAASSLCDKLSEAEAHLAAMGAEIQSLRTGLDLAQRQSDEERRRHQEEESALHAKLRDAEALAGKEKEDHQSARAAWEVLRRDLEDKIREPDERRAILEASLREAEERTVDLSRRSDAERERWETIRLEMDRQLGDAAAKISGLEEALRSAQSRCAELAGQLKSERSEWEVRRLELEKKGRATDDHRATVEEALRRMQGVSDEWAARARAKEEELAHALEELETQRAEVDRLQRQQRETSARYQKIIQKWASNFEQELAQAIARCEQAEQERMKLLTSREQAERESLEGQLAQVREECRRITESSASEKAALESEVARWSGRHRGLVSSSVAAYALTATDGLLLDCNQSFARLLGYGSAADVPKDGPEALKIPISGRAELAAQIESEGVLEAFEWSTLRADGKRVRILGSASLVPTGPDESRLIEWFFTDISEKQILEKELRQSRRMEAVGRLAAEVAPVISELLSSAEKQLHTLQGIPVIQRTGTELLAQMTRATARARTLTHQLRAFSQKQERSPETLDLDAELRRQEPVLRHLAGEDIELCLSLGAERHSVAIVRQELEQVLSTLVIVARDALPAGGTVTFETSRVDVQPGAPEPDAEVQPGCYILLSVKAEGCGARSAKTTSALEDMVRNNAGFIRVAAAHESETGVKIHFPPADTAGTAD